MPGRQLVRPLKPLSRWAPSSAVSNPVMVFSQMFADNFNQANGNLGGQNGWSTTSDGTMTIAGNEAKGVSAALAGNYRSGESYGNDQWAQCTVGSLNNISADFIGLSLRHNAGTNAEYAALAFDNGGTPELDLYYRTAPGAYTLILKRADGLATVAQGDTLRFFVVGNQLVFQKNGVTLLSTTDNHVPSGGSPGTSSFGLVTLDNWAGGNVSFGGVGAAIASDNFNRADGNMSSGQPNWTAITSTFSGVASVDPVIVSNQLNMPGASHYTAQRNETFSADQWAQIAGGSVAIGGAGFLGTIVRWNGTKGYMGCLFGVDSSYRIYLIQAGASSTQLAPASGQIFGQTNLVGETIQLIAKGNRISLLAGGAEVCAVNDSTCTTGQPGVQCFGPSTADNFSAGNA
jgi:hypothetical protein